MFRCRIIFYSVVADCARFTAGSAVRLAILAKAVYGTTKLKSVIIGE